MTLTELQFAAFGIVFSLSRISIFHIHLVEGLSVNQRSRE